MTSFFLHLQFAIIVNVECKIININQSPATAEQRFPKEPQLSQFWTVRDYPLPDTTDFVLSCVIGSFPT